MSSPIVSSTCTSYYVDAGLISALLMSVSMPRMLCVSWKGKGCGEELESAKAGRISHLLTQSADYTHRVSTHTTATAMLEGEPDIFNIAVDADDYAEAAAGDVPSVDRTYQSREDFERIKASYVAKHDDGNLREELLKQVPELTSGSPASVKLDKRHQLLLGYAVSELYYDRKYSDVIALLDRIETVCEIDDRLKKSMKKWRKQCEDTCH